MSKMSDIDIEIKELNATIEAQDKIIRFVTQCSRAKSAELHELKTNIRNGKQFIRNGFVDHYRP